MINSRFSLSGDATLYAGEEFSAELGFQNSDETPIPLAGRAFTLTLFRKHDRAVLYNVGGTVIDDDDPHVFFTICGSAVEGLYQQAEDHTLMYEISEVLADAKDIWVIAGCRILASALPGYVFTDTGEPVYHYDGVPASTDRITVLPTRRLLTSNRGAPAVLDYATNADVDARTSTTKVLTPASLDPIHSAIIDLATKLIRTQTIVARNLPSTG